MQYSNKSIIIIFLCLFSFCLYLKNTKLKSWLDTELINIAKLYFRDTNQISSHDIFRRAANVDIRTALREYYGNITFFFSHTP